MKRVSHKFDLWLAIFADHDFHHIEPDENVGIIEQLKPGERAPGDQFLFGEIDRVRRSSEIFVRPGFYFHKDKCVVVATNDVHFTAPAAAEISVENFVSFAPKEGAGEFFTAHAQKQMFGRRRETSAPTFG